jgi:outer membrane lipoprotein SlyB
MATTQPRLPAHVQEPAPLDGTRAARWWAGHRRPAARRGVLASAIAPLAGAVGALVLVVGLVGIGTNWWAGYSRDAIYGRAVQPDTSLAAVETGERLRETVTLLVRESDGQVRRLVAERGAADRFVNETLRRLDAERARIKRAAGAEVAEIFDLAFADAGEAVERYADWFFAWRRSYVVLKEAVVSTATRLVQFGNYEPITVAVERDLKDYFMRHYSEQVLRPEYRDPLIAAAFEAAARRAHERWLKVVAEQDLRLQLFLSRHTVHLDDRPPDGRMSEVVLDWDAQRFKAPAYLVEEKAFEGFVSLATVGTGGTLGALMLRPVVERATSRIFAGLGRQYAAAYAGRAAMAGTGARIGHAVQPVSGAVIGAVAGGVIGVAADYALNEANAALHRDGFVAAHKEAVELTTGIWQDRLEASLAAAIDHWFDDTRVAVVSAR